MYPTKEMIDTDYNQNPTIPQFHVAQQRLDSRLRINAIPPPPLPVQSRTDDYRRERARIAASKTAVKRKEKSIDYRRGRNQAA